MIFKKLSENAVLPVRAYPTDAGVDLTVTSKHYDVHTGTYIYGFGLAVFIPEGFVGFLLPRSSIYKTGLSLANSCGTIDAGYRGELKAIFRKVENAPIYDIGDRAVQLVVVPCDTSNTVWADQLPGSIRGTGGFGSSN